MIDQLINRLSIIFILMLFSSVLPGQLELARLFSDHMVLQREQPIKVWGWSNPGTKVTAQIGDETKSGTSNSKGEWSIVFDTRKAGGPYQMKIESGDESIEISDILIGDVWICSGQSNMEWTIEFSSTPEEFKEDATDHQIRHFKVPRSFDEKQSDRLEGGTWEVASSQTIENFTAVGYHFARNIRTSQNVPVGLINSSWGGSRIEPWMSSEMLRQLGVSDSPEEVMKEFQMQAEKRLQEIKKRFPYVSEEDAGYQNDVPIWSNDAVDTKDWMEIDHLALWEANGFENLDGIGWYRTHFYLTESEVKKDVTIHIGKIDDSDITWVNGIEVGRMDMEYNTRRAYQVKSDILRPGKNTLVVRCEDFGRGGGIYGTEDMFYMQVGNQSKPFENAWKFKIGAARTYNNTLGTNQIPTLLYNKMIHPMLSYPIKGVIWYQGESNAGSTTDASRYAELFRYMIIDWRKRWDIGEFPFLWVQLANFMAPDEVPSESNWAILRESQSKVLDLPETGQAVITDIGEADDIHPKNKHDVGYRLSLAARKIAYKEDLVYSGPVYKKHTIQRNMVFVTFDHVATGLAGKNDKREIHGFAIAGSDQNFIWANARIVGDQVMVWHEDIQNPKYIRYAWGNNPDNANLTNMEGLPACSFRTDK